MFKKSKVLKDFYIRLILFVYALMYNGYANGALAFNTIEPKHLQVKMRYLNLYLEFLKSESGLELEDDIECSSCEKVENPV